MMIDNIFRQKKLIEVFDKIHCLSVEGNNARNRHVDIIVIQNNLDRDLILDPTIRLETNHQQQDFDNSMIVKSKVSMNCKFYGSSSNTVSQVGKYLDWFENKYK